MPASALGPRAVRDPDWSQISGIENGIWLCPHHAGLVDTNDGKAYSHEILRSYKRLHEERIAREQRGIGGTFGWFQGILVERSPVFASGALLTLGKVTLLAGPNGSGKTALCDWIAGAADPFTLHRWWQKASLSTDLKYKVRYHSPEEKTLTVEITHDSIQFHDNESALTLLSPVPFRVVNLREPHLQGYDGRMEGEDDLSLLSRLLRMDSSVVWNALQSLNRFGTGNVRNAYLRDDGDQGGFYLHLDVLGTKPDLAYLALSHGERARVHLEIAIVVATMSAQHFPTILLLDGWLPHADRQDFVSYATMLASTERPFQTVMTCSDLDRLRDSLQGVEVVRLQPTDGGAKITQSLGGMEIWREGDTVKATC